MKTVTIANLLAFLAITSIALGVHGEEPISQIGFESLPPGTTLVSDTVTLAGNALVAGRLEVSGQIDASPEGVRFDDGSVQVSAVNQSLGYKNIIPDFVPPLPYSEVCFKQGQVLSDIHTVSESTMGGQCLPGDVGWVIERDERASSSWAEAMAACLVVGMRLPEPFEYQYSCLNEMSFGLNAMLNGREWSSNSTFAVNLSSLSGIAALGMGSGSCSDGATPWIARSDSSGIAPTPFRCVR